MRITLSELWQDEYIIRATGTTPAGDTIVLRQMDSKISTRITGKEGGAHYKARKLDKDGYTPAFSYCVMKDGKEYVFDTLAEVNIAPDPSGE